MRWRHYCKDYVWYVLSSALSPLDQVTDSCSYLLDGPDVLGVSAGTVFYCIAGNEKPPKTAATISAHAGYFFGKPHDLGSIEVAWHREGGTIGYEKETTVLLVCSLQVTDCRRNEMKFKFDPSGRHSIEL